MTEGIFAIGKSNNYKTDTELYYKNSFLIFAKGNSLVKIKFLETDLFSLTGYLLKAYYSALKNFKYSEPYVPACINLPGIKFTHCEAVICLESLDYSAKIQFRSADMLFDINLPITKLPALCQIIVESVREYEAYDGVSGL